MPFPMHPYLQLVYLVWQEIDSEFLISPINFVQNLIQKENYVSAIEINLVDKDKMFDVQKLSGLLGKNYIVKNQYQQQEFLYKILNTEKFVVLLILIFFLYQPLT